VPAREEMWVKYVVQICKKKRPGITVVASTTCATVDRGAEARRTQDCTQRSSDRDKYPDNHIERKRGRRGEGEGGVGLVRRDEVSLWEGGCSPILCGWVLVDGLRGRLG
jgi:hypothetical protein